MNNREINEPRPDPPIKDRNKVTEAFLKDGSIIDDATGQGGVVDHVEAQPYMLQRGKGDVEPEPNNPDKINWPMPKEVTGE